MHELRHLKLFLSFIAHRIPISLSLSLFKFIFIHGMPYNIYMTLTCLSLGWLISKDY